MTDEDRRKPLFEWPLATTVSIEIHRYRTFYLDLWPVWDRCVSCGQEIHPPQLWYDHEPTRQKAHVECP